MKIVKSITKELQYFMDIVKKAQNDKPQTKTTKKETPLCGLLY